MDVIIVFLVLLGIYHIQIDNLIKKFAAKQIFIKKRFINYLFGVHLFCFLLYLGYTFYNRSDSGMYYIRAQGVASWWVLFEDGTLFIDFLNYPFIKYLKLSYYSVMLIFSFAGFQGILLLYLTGKEHIKNELPIKYAGFTMLELLLFLPNIHFWSSSIGKGSIMVLGIGLFFYGLSRINIRLLYLLLGTFIIYMVRKHILSTIILGVGVGMLFGNSKINKFVKFIIVCSAFIGFFIFYKNLAEETGFDFTDENNESLEHLSSELGKSNSGVDINNYNIFFKLFTFLYRPLFVDAPNFVGIISSFEDVIYLILTLQMFIIIFNNFKSVNSFFIILIVAFFMSSLALCQITGNLGIAVRQKAQIYPLFIIFYSKLLSISKRSKLVR